MGSWGASLYEDDTARGSKTSNGTLNKVEMEMSVLSVRVSKKFSQRRKNWRNRYSANVATHGGVLTAMETLNFAEEIEGRFNPSVGHFH